MLVLTRQLGQTITIGKADSPEPPIEVTIIEVHGDQVRIGFTAPRDTPVNRTEIWAAKQAEKAGVTE